MRLGAGVKTRVTPGSMMGLMPLVLLWVMPPPLGSMTEPMLGVPTGSELSTLLGGRQFTAAVVACREDLEPCHYCGMATDITELGNGKSIKKDGTVQCGNTNHRSLGVSDK